MNDTFKKINLKLLGLLIVLIALLGVMAVNQNQVQAATIDYSPQVVVTDWKLLNSSGQEASETNPVTNNSKWQLNVSWTLEPNGTTIQEGDTFSINLPSISNDTGNVTGSWSTLPSDYEYFKDSNGTEIGQWRISGGKIQAVFNDKAVGSAVISGNFTTGETAITVSYLSTTTQQQTVTMGNVAKTISFKGLDAMQPIAVDSKGYSNASNSQIRWFMRVNSNGLTELTNNGLDQLGKNFTKKNTYLEDTLTGGGTVANIVIQSRIAYPIDLTTGRGGQIAGTNYMIDVTKQFKLVTQNASESYADFKARLEPLQYGIYTDNTGVKTVIIYFGKIGDNGLKYSNLNANFANSAADAPISSGYYTEDDRQALIDYYTATYGDDNVIHGNVAAYLVYIYANYDKVVNDTPKSNTAILTQDGVVNNLTTAPATLQGILGNVTLSSTQAGLFLSDQDTQALLPGATFKLQILKDDVWSDYTGAGTLTTDSDGFIQTPDLGAGTYRFVELTTATNEYDLRSSQGYDSNARSVVSDQFTIVPTAAQGPKVNVTNVKYKFDIAYTKGTHGTFVTDVFNGVAINSSTPAFDGTMSGEDGYHFSGWSPTVADKVTADTTYEAQWAPDVYDITYTLDGGTNDSANPKTYTYGIGVDSFKEPSKAGYKFLGWVDEDGNTITNISETAMGNKTLIAKWEAVTMASPNSIIPDNTEKAKKVPVTGADTLLIAGIIGSLGLGLTVLKRSRKL